MKTCPLVCLLLWTLTASVSCADESKITVKRDSDKTILSCGDKYEMTSSNGDPVKKLSYSDENTGEYKCVISKGSDALETEGPKIYVKFQTCDNCIELNPTVITGLVIGDVVATVVILVAVYLIASQSHIGPITSHKKSSDRQLLVPNEVSSRASNDHYQELMHKRDVYDELTNRR